MLFEILPEDVIPLDDSKTLTEAKALILIEDCTYRAFGLVPELQGELTDLQFKASRGIIRKAVLRAHSAGSGAVTQRSVATGGFSESETVDNKQTDRAVFTQNELKELRGLFNIERKAFKGKAYSINLF